MTGQEIVKLSEVTAPAYKPFWRSKATYIVCKGSRASGKSKHAALWLIYSMMKFPLANALVVRKVLDTMRDSVCADLIWAMHRLKVEEYWDYPTKKTSPLIITYKPTGQKIIFKGLDDSKKATSVSVSVGVLCWLFIEEAYEIDDEADFDTLDESIRGELPPGYFKRVLMIFNPWSESTWIKSRFFDAPSDKVLTMTTTYMDNPWLSDTDRAIFEDMRINRPERYRVAGLGDWGISGAVYFEEFDPDVHVVQPFQIPDYWRIERAIDYGLDALACLYVAIDPEGNAYVISEVYKHGLIVSDAAAAIQNGEPRQQTRWVTYAPPDLWSRTKDTGRTIDEIYRDCGVPLTKSDNNRISGWMQIHERLKVVDDVDGGKTARIKIFSSCKNLIRCISTIKADEDNINDCATEPHELTHLCVSGDTLVKTPHGYSRIDSLVGTQGECISYDEETGEEVIGEYDCVVMTNPAAEVYEVELADGTKIKATAKHKVLTAAGWKTFEELTESDDIITV